MLLRRIAIENVRSFLDRAELRIDGTISIIIGPNGGGKTNLLDAVVTMLRRHLLASMYPVHVPTPTQNERYEFRQNDVLNQMVLERHSRGTEMQQSIELEIEITRPDLENMSMMKASASELVRKVAGKYINLRLDQASGWNLQDLKPGERVTYRLDEHARVTHESGASGDAFLQYLRLYEMDNQIRGELGAAPLTLPMIYLPVNRSNSTFQSRVQLASYNDAEQKRQIDAIHSRSNASVFQLAIGRLAQKYRLTLEQDKGNAALEFRAEENLKELTRLLREMGYEWELATVSALRNEYDVKLRKQGSEFLLGAASSGERELFTYLFAIFGLNIRDALIIIDEPELHLHPKWQKALLSLFERLQSTTGNQFVMATHSPTFVSPDSVQYVSRVYSREQRSHIVRLDPTALPDVRQLLNIVNSQNNERIFFADILVLVEGLSDRVFFEAVLDVRGRERAGNAILEVVSVGGKGFFAAYQKLLRACQVKCFVIADLDYVEQIGDARVKALFQLDNREIKKDVVDNIKSVDGATLVARIEEAIKSGSWRDAEATWAYIKAHRQMLKPNLSAEEADILECFISAQRGEGVYVLRRGALESYLPEGYRSKDMAKLIDLVKREGFWDALDLDAQREIGDIVDELLRAPV